MSKRNKATTRNERAQATSEAQRAHEGQGDSAPSEVAREQVAALAYELWESHGRPEGTDLEDWFRAEQLLKGPA